MSMNILLYAPHQIIFVQAEEEILFKAIFFEVYWICFFWSYTWSAVCVMQRCLLNGFISQWWPCFQVWEQNSNFMNRCMLMCVSFNLSDEGCVASELCPAIEPFKILQGIQTSCPFSPKCWLISISVKIGHSLGQKISIGHAKFFREFRT